MTTSRQHSKILTSLAILSTLMPMRANARYDAALGFVGTVGLDIVNWRLCSAPPYGTFEEHNPGVWEPLCENIRTNSPTVCSLPFFGYHFTTNQLETLFSVLKENHTIQYVDMGYTGLAGDYIDQLLDAVKDNPNLKGLNLESLPMNGANIKKIGSFLMGNKTVEDFILGVNWWRKPSEEPHQVWLEEIKPLTDALRQNNTLKTFTLKHWQMFPDAMAELFDALKENKSITELDLTNSFLDKEESADLLADYVASNPHVKKIMIWNSKLGPGSGKKIAKALEKNTNLRELWAGGNNFSKEDFYVIAKMLPKNKTLKVLYCDGERDEAVGTALANAMLNNSSITTAGFIDYQKMNENDIKTITQAAKFNSKHEGQDITLGQWRKTHKPDPRNVQDWERWVR